MVEHWLTLVQQVGGLHAEYASQRRHLAHARVGDGPGPDALDLFLREVPERHAGDLGVRVRLAGLRVPDNLE